MRHTLKPMMISDDELDMDGQDDDAPEPNPPAQENVKNYMTPNGAAALEGELRFLLKEERPKIVEIVSWAAGNGDRSENGDYLYNKKRLREIDRRIRYLMKRLDKPEIVDPKKQQGLEQVYFGATVTYARPDGSEVTVKLVGIDEADMESGKINWQSPVAQALMKKRIGDIAIVRVGTQTEKLEIIDIEYRL